MDAGALFVPVGGGILFVVPPPVLVGGCTTGAPAKLNVPASVTLLAPLSLSPQPVIKAERLSTPRRPVRLSSFFIGSLFLFLRFVLKSPSFEVLSREHEPDKNRVTA